MWITHPCPLPTPFSDREKERGRGHSRGLYGHIVETTADNQHGGGHFLTKMQYHPAPACNHPDNTQTMFEQYRYSRCCRISTSYSRLHVLWFGEVLVHIRVQSRNIRELVRHPCIGPLWEGMQVVHQGRQLRCNVTF